MPQHEDFGGSAVSGARVTNEFNVGDGRVVGTGIQTGSTQTRRFPDVSAKTLRRGDHGVDFVRVTVRVVEPSCVETETCVLAEPPFGPVTDVSRT